MQLELFKENIVSKRLDTHIERDADLLIIPESIHTIPCTHGIHRFAGKFIPNLPRYLIREFLLNSQKRVLLDPFCGSGTTLVEAALEGKRFIGLDIDPLSVLISSVKTQALTNHDILLLEKFWENHIFSKSYPEVIPDVPNLIHWFNEKSIEELSSIKYRCLELPSLLKQFSLVVFSSIIRRVSNADDQTQKTYVSHTLPKKPPLPSSIFPIFLKRAIEGMKHYSFLLPSAPNGSIFKGDAVKDILNFNFDDVITSPPYIDSIDYVYNQMLEYFWLLKELDIHSYENYRLIRKSPMGFRTYSNNLFADFSKNYLSLTENIFNKVCLLIGDKSPKEEIVVRSFFVDYANHVKNVLLKQKPGGIYICIVGNSIIRGFNVPTADIIQDIHISAGYNLLHKLNYEIKRHYMKFPRRENSGKIKQDYVLIFEAPI